MIHTEQLIFYSLDTNGIQKILTLTCFNIISRYESTWLYKLIVIIMIIIIIVDKYQFQSRSFVSIIDNNVSFQFRTGSKVLSI